MSRGRTSAAFSGPARQARAGWVRPLRRARRALGSTMRRIEESCRLLDASECLGRQRPLRASHQLILVYKRMTEAGQRLVRANLCIQETLSCIRQAPESAGGAPKPVMLAMLQATDAAVQLHAVMARLSGTSTWLAAVSDTAPASAFRPLIVPPRPPAARWFLEYCPSRPIDRIQQLLKRRRPAVAVTVAEAPKRVSRGRAPPFVSICLL